MANSCKYKSFQAVLIKDDMFTPSGDNVDLYKKETKYTVHLKNGYGNSESEIRVDRVGDSDFAVAILEAFQRVKVGDEYAVDEPNIAFRVSV